MVSPRFSLALDQLGSTDWAEFERLAAEFLAVEYPSLRTMASKSGDKGRDGELFIPEEDSTVAFQYSVTADWSTKIGATKERLTTSRPSVRTIVYVTNVEVGPKADELKVKLRNAGFVLDVRDKSWFTDREMTHPQRQSAAAELAARYVDPLLRARGVVEGLPVVLSSAEARLAVLHLSLDAEDKATDKGLTKTCFESLTLAALDGSSSSSTYSRDLVVERVNGIFPAGKFAQVEALTISALVRLSKKGGPVNHHRSTDEYCLSHNQVQQNKDRVATYIKNETALEAELAEMARPLMERPVEGTDSASSLSGVARALREVIERILLAKGEAFVHAVSTGTMNQIDLAEAETIVDSVLPLQSSISRAQALAITFDAIQRPSESTQRHLQRLGDAYTLFAFLRQTPDVQKTIVKIFNGGDIWLDTSVILPLIGETLLGEQSEKHFTVLLRAARDAGIRLHITDGIIEEVERHLNRSLAYSRAGSSWRGRIPFVYAIYAASGRDRAAFRSWVEEFRGDGRPEDDVREALQSEFGIRRRSLTDLSDQADSSLRIAVQEVWQEVHDRRRDEDEIDLVTRARLVQHDVENCVGVIQARRGEPDSPVGYGHWYLTLDRRAFRLREELAARMGREAPASPVLSPDFLAEYLRVGACRTAIDSELRVHLPLLTDIGRLGQAPESLVRRSDEIRRGLGETSEHVIRRRVRDMLDQERRRIGLRASGGLGGVQRDLEAEVRS